jgi:hypothetical protein
MDFRMLDTKADWEWIKSRAKILLVEDTSGLVVENNGVIQAIAVFDSFTRNACNVHVAIENPRVIKHGFLNEIGRHLFHVCGRSRIFGLVPSNNAKALKLNKHIGMQEVSCVPNALAEGVDYIIMEMKKEDCRWIEQKREVA